MKDCDTGNEIGEEFAGRVLEIVAYYLTVELGPKPTGISMI